MTNDPMQQNQDHFTDVSQMVDEDLNATKATEIVAENDQQDTLLIAIVEALDFKDAQYVDEIQDLRDKLKELREMALKAMDDRKKLQKENAELKAQLATAVDALKKSAVGMGYVIDCINTNKEFSKGNLGVPLNRIDLVLGDLAKAVEYHNEAMREEGRREATNESRANESQKQGLYEPTKEEQHDV